MIAVPHEAPRTRVQREDQFGAGDRARPLALLASPSGSISALAPLGGLHPGVRALLVALVFGGRFPSPGVRLLSVRLRRLNAYGVNA